MARRRNNECRSPSCMIAVFGIFIFLLFNLFDVLQAEEDGGIDSSKYLYLNDPDAQGIVREYTQGDKIDFFTSANNPRIVEFYNPYCGACKAFKSKYIQKAKEMVEIYPNLEFYTVSCGAYNDVCKYFEIMGVPSILPIAAGKIISYPPDSSSTNTDNTDSVIDKNEVNKDHFLNSRNFDLSKVEEILGLTDADKVKTSSRTLEEDDGGTYGAPDAKLFKPGFTSTKHIASVAKDNARMDPRKYADREKYLEKRRQRRNSEEADKYKDYLKEKIARKKKRAAFQGLTQKHREEGQHFAPPEKKKKLKWNSVKNRREKEMPNEGSTDLMRENQPGTIEFAEKRDNYFKNIEKKRNALKLKHDKLWKKKERKTSSTVEDRVRERMERNKDRTNADAMATTEADPVGKLPFKKVVSKERIAEKIPVVKHFRGKMSDEEALMLDVSLAFRQSLEMGLYKTFKPLDSTRKQAFKDWLDLLTVTIPPEWGLLELVTRLNKDIDKVSSNQREFMRVLEEHKLPRKKYSKQCRKGNNALSCGFWRLLHVVTVGTAETRGGLNLIEAGMAAEETHVFSPLETGDVIRNYMEHFFHCSDCANHFIKKYDDCYQNDRCERLTSTTFETSDSDWKEPAKWLWEVHNEVSVRLLNEKRAAKKQRKAIGTITNGKLEMDTTPEDPELSISALWPNMFDCVLCLNEDGTWNEDAVFLKLEETYWHGDIDIFKNKRNVVWYDDEDGLTGRGLAIFWIIACCVLAYYLRDSLTSTNLQRTVLKSKSLLTATLNPQGSAGKRST